MSRDDLTDPTDWSGLPIATVSSLDSGLRCQVCKDFFKTPMLTSCSHTFCSLCIRRCLTEDGKCPACRAQETVNKLRRNAAVEELVDAFQSARPSLLRLGQEAAHVNTGLKRRFDDKGDQRPGMKSIRQTRSQSRPNEEKLSNTDNLPGHIRTPVVEEGNSLCPICQKEMRIELVYQHLDTHNGQADPAKTTPDSGSSIMPVYSTLPHPTHLPNINYSIMNETTLRKKLASLGIPANGSKIALQRRHTAYVNIWNANCDSSRPKSKRQLLQELDVWERNESAPQADTIMTKHFDSKAWSTQHDLNFQDLIAQARSKKSTQKNESPDET